MKTAATFVIGAILLGGGQEKGPARELAWLAGSWEGDAGGQAFEEHWMTPVGGVMIGMGRMVKGDKTVFTEFLKIVETKDGLQYRVIIEGKETVFPVKTRTEGEVVFENLKHDFPQRIGYRKEKDGILAWIEGEGQKSGRMDFRLKAKK